MSIIGDILCPLGAVPLVLTDGPTVYGSAIAAPTGQPLVYAPKQAGATTDYPTGTYSATGLPGTVTRPYINGHLAYNSFPPFNAGSYWEAALDDTKLAAWDRDGDWLMLVGVGDQGAVGAHGSYTIAECLIAPAPSPYTGGESAWFGWGGQPDSGSGVPFGLFIDVTHDVKVEDGGIDGGSSNQIGLQLIHKLGNTVTVYSANSSGLTTVVSNGAYPTMGLPAPPSGAKFLAQRHLYASVDLTLFERLLTMGIIAGTMQTSDVAAFAAAVIAGKPMYTAPVAPINAPQNLHWSAGTCEGAQISLAWDAVTGSPDGYEITSDPAIVGEPIRTAVASAVLTGATIGTSYIVAVRAYNSDCLGAFAYGPATTLLVTPCSNGTAPHGCYYREAISATPYTRETVDCDCG